MTETAGDALHIEKVGAALRVTFNRPQQLNAFTSPMLEDLCDLLEEASVDPSVRVVVVSAGGRAFSSGADLNAIGATSNEPGMEVLRVANRVVRAIRAMPQPVIAAVNGAAVGVGCSVALACDVVFAAESAYFLLPFVGIALMPDGGATALVPAAVGRSRALGMALVGDRLSASEAERWGLIYRVVPDDEFDGQVGAIVDRFAAGSPPALAATKHAINDITLAALDAALDREAAGQAKLLSSVDFAEAVAAFAERRPPRFSRT
jgi:enoyl-CoA hydratase